MILGAVLTLLGAGSISVVGWYVWVHRGFSLAPESAQAGVCAIACSVAVLGAVLVLLGGDGVWLAMGGGVGFAGSGAVLAWATRPIARQASPETVEQLRGRLAELELERAREWERGQVAQRQIRAANWDRMERELGRLILFERRQQHV